jgi:hypothetical protein
MPFSFVDPTEFETYMTQVSNTNPGLPLYPKGATT